ncbi:MAG: hypothetical protein NT001_03605 [Candidatus Woesearchaeota archaeon]|nr:hypothetical protein [Candidatus Woesearchaeota archaeon]
MKNKILFVISLVVLVFFAAACSQTGTTSAPKEVGITISPEDQVATETPAATAATESPANTEENVTQETQQPATGAASSESGLPEITCDEKETLGFLKCAKQDSGDSELTIRNSGREDISGIYIQYYKGSEVVGSKSEISALSAGNDSTVMLEIKKYAADRIEVFPIWDSNICINKQIMINPEVNCR